MADSSIFTKEEVATKDLLAGMIDSLTEMKFRLNGIDAPRIVSVETDRDGDNLCGDTSSYRCVARKKLNRCVNVLRR